MAKKRDKFMAKIEIEATIYIDPKLEAESTCKKYNQEAVRKRIERELLTGITAGEVCSLMYNGAENLRLKKVVKVDILK